MEGYYNDTIFHRIVANFIVQGGDPEGTGLGGESIYEGGEPFVDEFHSRLRFVRRGLVAMANSGVPNDNRSQFFITLDATMELQNKHTIFGKVIYFFVVGFQPGPSLVTRQMVASKKPTIFLML